MKAKNKVFIALGSNKGDLRANILSAVAHLAQTGNVLNISPLIETAPEGYADQDDFLNGALVLETALAPHELLKNLKKIEAQLGRKPTFKNGPREIDLDIIFYNDLILQTDSLTIPHPRAHERVFVLEPLCALAPDFRHPVLGLTVCELMSKNLIS